MTTRFSAGLLAGAVCVAALTGSARAADTAPTDPGRTVHALERAWLDAYEQLDTLAMDRIVATDFLITFPDGSQQTKVQIISALRTMRGRPGPYTTRFRTEGTTARVYGRTVVLTGVVVTIDQRGGKTIEDRARYTDTYVERDGRWQVVASHLSNVPADKPKPPAPVKDASTPD